MLIYLTLYYIKASVTNMLKASSESPAAASFSLKDNLFTTDTGSALYIVTWTLGENSWSIGFQFYFHLVSVHTIPQWTNMNTSCCVNMQEYILSRGRLFLSVLAKETGVKSSYFALFCKYSVKGHVVYPCKLWHFPPSWFCMKFRCR